MLNRSSAFWCLGLHEVSDAALGHDLTYILTVLTFMKS